MSSRKRVQCSHAAPARGRGAPAASRPSSHRAQLLFAHPPSTWCAALATPHRKPGGKRTSSVSSRRRTGSRPSSHVQNVECRAREAVSAPAARACPSSEAADDAANTSNAAEATRAAIDLHGLGLFCCSFIFLHIRGRWMRRYGGRAQLQGACLAWAWSSRCGEARAQRPRAVRGSSPMRAHAARLRTRSTRCSSFRAEAARCTRRSSRTTARHARGQHARRRAARRTRTAAASGLRATAAARGQAARRAPRPSGARGASRPPSTSARRRLCRLSARRPRV